MIDIAKLKIGDKVHYQPKHYGSEKWENGIVKEIPAHSTDSVRVVYNCAGDWKNYFNGRIEREFGLRYNNLLEKLGYGGFATVAHKLTPRGR